ncbi:hypothetical protein ASG60_19630 [Methylobacterium sp. Leaf469]|uniref:hypothetical protein n=1 Tax=Methylobacterium sp. Leaf469 TaxID=1736387 RepID=UPI0006F280E9|nr:hypothetical protein [Methylobacterium sp. Leaf469]KQU00001.1 hypothetical protein ASG60_19630 [Methylobacterium sp. Leaf469]
MQHTPEWRRMNTAPQDVDRVWLRHRTLGIVLAEGRAGRWYAPNAARQIWRWHRCEAGPDPFEGWLPFDALTPTPAAIAPSVPAAAIPPPAQKGPSAMAR